MINFLFQYIPAPIQYIDITLRREVQGCLHCMELLYSPKALDGVAHLLLQDPDRWYYFCVSVITSQREQSWPHGDHYSKFHIQMSLKILFRIPDCTRCMLDDILFSPVVYGGYDVETVLRKPLAIVKLTVDWYRKENGL